MRNRGKDVPLGVCMTTCFFQFHSTLKKHLFSTLWDLSVSVEVREKKSVVFWGGTGLTSNALQNTSEQHGEILDE